MARLEVKICGLTTPGAVAAAAKGRARYAGFVFVPASPRHIAPEAAASLRKEMPSEMLAVALTVDAGDDELSEIVACLRPDMLQLHGAETAARIAAVRARFGLPVIKACAVADKGDVAAALALESAADHLLFDARPPKDSARTGGHGQPFDWSLLTGAKPKKPWFLSGGLTADNLADAVAQTGARRVDVSSGVERAKGQKDEGLIKAFLDLARTL